MGVTGLTAAELAFLILSCSPYQKNHPSETQKNITNMRETNVKQMGAKNTSSNISLLNLQGQGAEMSRTDFQQIWNSTGLPPSHSKHAPARPAEF
jgi:hypothetical protein